jgi:hypothetical protein
MKITHTELLKNPLSKQDTRSLKQTQHTAQQTRMIWFVAFA